MAVVTAVNKDVMALGLWDIHGKYHVARGMGGVVVLEPNRESIEVIALLSEIGTISTTSSDVPVLTDTVSISGVAEVGETLTADGGTWVGADSLAYQWLVAGVEVGGATEQTFVVPEGAAGEWVEVEVTATNTSGSTTETSDQFGPIAEV